METDSQQTPAELQNMIQTIELEIARFQTLVTNEDDKMIRYKVRFDTWSPREIDISICPLHKG